MSTAGTNNGGASANRASGMAVLVHEDAEVRKAYGAVLREIGLVAVTASDGEEGLSLLYSNVPKLLVLDVVLPDIDGIDLCRRARELLGDKVAILFLSSIENLEIVELCLEAGGNDFLMANGDHAKFAGRCIFWARAGRERKREKHRARTLAAIRAEVQERESQARGQGGGLSSENDPDVAEMSRFINLAREAAGSEFGHTIEEKLYLLGYVAGVVNYWASLKVHMKTRLADYLRAVLRETDILTHHEIKLLLAAWSELSEDPTFADAVNKGTYEAVARTAKGKYYTPTGLSKFHQSAAQKSSMGALHSKLFGADPQVA